MKLSIRSAPVLSISLILGFAGPGLAQTLTLGANGTINGTNNTVTFSFSVNNGKKLDANNWLVSLTINGVNIDVTKCGLTSLNGGANGKVEAPIKLAQGTYPVNVVVNLSGGCGKATGKGNVSFKNQLGCCCPPPCCPPELELNEGALIIPSQMGSIIGSLGSYAWLFARGDQCEKD